MFSCFQFLARPVTRALAPMAFLRLAPTADSKHPCRRQQPARLAQAFAQGMRSPAILAALALALGSVAVAAGPALGFCPLRPTSNQGDVGFGVSSALPGDLNADGYADLVVGATSDDASGDTSPGRVYIYFGGPQADVAPELVLTGAAAGDRFGYSVAPAGDLNSDGWPDLVVGAYNAGKVHVYFGGPAFDATPDLVLQISSAGDHFGRAVAGVGDVSGDGHDDLLVGAELGDRVYVYFGGPGLDAAPDRVSPWLQRTVYAAAPAGDVNGDGHADFVVGGYEEVLAFWGGPNADAIPDVRINTDQLGSGFGAAVAGADVNGDGYSDILVGAPQRDGGSGRAYIFFGGQSVDTIADLVFPGSAGEQMGRAVAAGIDVDSDGTAMSSSALRRRTSLRAGSSSTTAGRGSTPWPTECFRTRPVPLSVRASPSPPGRTSIATTGRAWSSAASDVPLSASSASCSSALRRRWPPQVTWSGCASAW